MSSNIYWQPNEIDRGHTDLGKKDDTLKLTLREAFGYPLDVTFDESDIKLFKGMAMAGIKDAEKVIEHIQKYGSIRIWEAE